MSAMTGRTAASGPGDERQLRAVHVDLAVGASGKIIPRRRMSGSSTEL
jgi:hypothetical protein